MSSECKGVCDSNNESQLKLGYKNGQKYCKKCQIYFLTKEIRCYCCKNVLRSKKKHNKTTNKMKFGELSKNKVKCIQDLPLLQL